MRAQLLHDDPRNIQRAVELMLVKARLGETDEAARIASHVIEFAPHHPGKLFSVARAYAICAGQAGAVASAQRHAFIDRGLGALRQAVASGFKDVTAAKTCPDLQALRDRSEYRDLVAELSVMNPGESSR